MSELVKTFKSPPEQNGVEGIRIPSERPLQERIQRRIEGIVVEKKIVAILEAL